MRIKHKGLLLLFLFTAAPALLLCMKWPVGDTGRLWILAFGVMVMTWYAPLADRLAVTHRRLGVVLSITLTMCISVWLWGPNLRAEWGLIDDHEIIRWLGNSSRLSPSEAANILSSHPEFADCWNAWPRFRPSYFLLRTGEATLWGIHPTAWYAFRMFLFGACLWMGWYVLDKFLGYWGGFWASLWGLTLSANSDIWSHLGPAEAYGTAGLALYASGACILLYTRHRAITAQRLWAGASMLMIGALTAMGSKENFLFLVPLTWLIISVFFFRRGFHWSILLCGLVISASGAGFVAVLLHKLGSLGEDIYGREVQVESKLELLRMGILRFLDPSRAGGTVGLLIILSIVYAKYIGTRRACETLVCVWLCVAASTGIYASQQVVYGVGWPCGSRYDCPGMWCTALVSLVTLWLSLHILSLLKTGPFWRRALLCSLLVSLSIDCYLSSGLLRKAARKNAADTRAVSTKINLLVARLRREPAKSLVVDSYQPEDYEPATALAIFLKAYGVENSLFLRIHYEGKLEIKSLLWQKIGRDMKAFSAQGYGGYRPIAELSHSLSWFTCSLSGDSNGLDGEYLGQVWPCSK